MRKPRDNYYTDDRLTRAICARLAGLIPAPDAVVEPSAGDGAFIAAARAVWPDSSISGVDVDERCRDACVAAKADVFVAGDFLRAELGGPFGLVVGNPPYGGAEDFVRRSLEVTRDGGHVAFLLRSSFLHGQKRSMWVLKDLRQDRPGRVLDLRLAEEPRLAADDPAASALAHAAVSRGATAGRAVPMSTDRWAQEEKNGVAYARCRKAPKDVYTVAYMGTQRAPRPGRMDEVGAIAVIDLLFGGRMCIYAIAGDNEWRRVERRK